MRILVVLNILIALWSCSTESTVDPRYEDYFIKYYGAEGDQFGIDLLKVDDGFVILAESRPVQQGKAQIMLVKVDELGNTMWSRDYGTTVPTVPVDLEMDPAGDFIIAATTQSAPGDTDIILFKVGADGAKIDSAVFGQVGELEVVNSLTITAEGDYIVTGSTTGVDTSKPDYQPSTDFEDIYSIRTTSDFVPYSTADWRRVYGFSGIDRGQRIFQKEDGSFLFFGTTNRPAVANSQQAGFNMFLFPAGQDGIASSAGLFHLFGTLSDEYAADMVRAAGGYVMLGSSVSGEGSSPFLAKIGNNNDFISSGTIDIDENVVAASMDVHDAGGFLVLAKEVVSTKDSNIFLIRLSAGGNEIWRRNFGGVDIDDAGTVTALDDGTIVFVGSITLGSQSKACLIKVNASGDLKP